MIGVLNFTMQNGDMVQISTVKGEKYASYPCRRNYKHYKSSYEKSCLVSSSSGINGFHI